MVSQHWVKEWVRRDGLYLVTIGLCLIAILYLSNGADKAVAECNKEWSAEFDKWFGTTTPIYIDEEEDNNGIENINKDTCRTSDGC